MFKHIYKLALPLACLMSQLSGPCSAECIDELLLFGDSYFDTGAGNVVSAEVGVNLISPEPYYFNGRHSNGPIWIDYTSQDLGLPVIDYAVAGSETGTGNVNTPPPFPDMGGLFQQLQRYESTSTTIPSNALVIVDGAGNDFLNLLNNPSMLTPAGVTLTAAQALQNLATVFTQLEKLGAQKIIVWNLGDLSRLPLFNNPVFGLNNPALRALYQGASLGFNAALPGVVKQLNSEAFHVINDLNGEQQIFIFDAYTAFNQLADELEAQGINLASVALIPEYVPLPIGASTYIYTGLDPAHLAFYDGVHPTTYAWSLFANTTAAYIDTIINAPRFMAAEVDLALETAKAHRDLVENHFRTLNVERYIYNRCCNNYCDCGCGCECFQLYTDAEGKWGSTPNKCGNLGFNYSTGLALIGLDYRIGPNLTIGASFTAQTSHARIRDGRGSMNFNDYVPTLYAAYFGDCFFVNMASSYHYGIFRNIKRNIPFLDLTAKGRCDAMAGEYNLEAGYVMECDCLTLIPILGVDVETLAIRGYTENCAGFLNMTTNRQHQRSCVSRIGAQVFWDAFDGCFLPFGELFYEHEFLRNGRLMGPRFANSLDGAKDYNHTSPPNRDVLRYSLGLDARLYSCVVGNISYIGDTNFREYTNAIRAQVDVAF